MGTEDKLAILCPRCRRLISRDEPVCPHCGLSRPGSRKVAAFLGRLGAGAVNPVQALLYANVAFYLLSLLLNPASLGFSLNPLSFLSPSDASLFYLGATGTVPVLGYGRWWSLFTASFLHGGLLHIFFNMFALVQLGPFVWRQFGFWRFWIIYMTSGVGGFLLSVVAGVPFTIGASAGLCGLIGAILYYGKSRGGFMGEMISRQAMGWIVGLAVFGLLLPGINNWAHGGGLVAGIGTAWLTGHRDRGSEAAVHRALGAVLLGVTFLFLLYAVAGALSLVLR
jgi:rhomboid protease GluP